jgi:hypothetical protein
MKPTREQLIDSLVANCRQLLTDNWGRAEQVFAATNIKINIAHLIDFDGAAPTAKSTISFGARVRQSVEVKLDGNQTELGLHSIQGDGEGDGEAAFEG